MKSTLLKPGLLFVCALFLIALAVPAQAEFVHVDCAGGPSPYTTINAALAHLSAQSLSAAHHVVVHGACAEFVNVNKFADLTIEGADSSASLQAGSVIPPFTHATLLAMRSKLILRNLTIRGVISPSVRLGGVLAVDSNVAVRSCTIENGNSGIVAQGNSNVSVESSTVQNNSTNIGVSGPAAVQVGKVEGDVSPTVVSGGNLGVSVNPGGVAAIFGATVIKQNGAGVYSHSGNVFFCCNNELTRQVIENGTGMRFNGGSLNLNGNVLVADNRFVGIQLRGAVLTINWNGGLAVKRNGSSGTPPYSGGILAQTGSSVRLIGAEVSENYGPGLFVESGSAALLSTTVIRGNTVRGIQVSAAGNVEIASTSSVTGNGGTDLFCTPNSYAFGDKTVIGKMICPTFDHSPNPLPGPEQDQP